MIDLERGLQPGAVYNVRDFGAKGDGTTLDTRAIQAGIDACARTGGAVYFPQGTYLTGTLWLRSNVTLEISTSATLLGSTSLADYSTDNRPCCFVNEPQLDKCLIYAEHASNIGLKGPGAIDGQGGAFRSFDEKAERLDRPMLIRFVECENVRIESVNLRSAGSWCANLVECAHVWITGVYIHNRVNVNNDGIDLTSSEKVHISDTTIICQDDAICFQPMSHEKGVRDITITNCILSTRWAAIRTGGAGRGGIHNVTVSNCVIYDTYGCAIKLQISGGATMDSLVFSNIVMKNVSCPISLRFGNHHYNNEERDTRYPMGGMKNIQFSNIRASVCDEQTLRSATGEEFYEGEERQPISICGIPGQAVEDITLSDIHVTWPGEGTAEDAAHKDFPEHEDEYPEYFMWGALPAYGLYARHVRGLRLRGIRFDTCAADARPAFYCDDVRDIELRDVRADVSDQADGMVSLREAQDVVITGCVASAAARALVHLDGGTCGDIWLNGNRPLAGDTEG